MGTSVSESRVRTLLTLKSATTAYLEVLNLALPDLARLGDRTLLVAAETALLETAKGTPANIGKELREIPAIPTYPSELPVIPGEKHGPAIRSLTVAPEEQSA